MSSLNIEKKYALTWNKYKKEITSNAVSHDSDCFTIDGKVDNTNPIDVEKSVKSVFLEYALKADPTGNGKYIQWLAWLYANGGVKRLEDLPSRLGPCLKLFHTRRQKLLSMGYSNDIYKYKTITEFEDVCDLLKKEVEAEEACKLVEGTDYEHYEDSNWNIYVPLNQEASIYYGRGTRWCTASESSYNYFDSYNKPEIGFAGRLYIMVPKKAVYPGQKYQISLESDCFMNEKDNTVNSDDSFFKMRSSFLQEDLLPRYEKYLEENN